MMEQPSVIQTVIAEQHLHKEKPHIVLTLLTAPFPKLLKIFVALLQNQINGHLLPDAIVELEDMLEPPHFLVDTQFGFQDKPESLELLEIAV
jgi:hypothetical protein